ncbi:hypothetical protein F4819DRAFT_400104 [Hypoxylon fuscum]|nr:hypothetical protein F4819DRAFT_400104 [Hypoxylon fuscum]
MQFTMGRSTNDYQAPVPVRPVSKPDPFRHGHTKQNRYGKAQPFDPDDLRRRLYVVIAERESLKERQRRERSTETRTMQNEEQDVFMSLPEIGKTNPAVLEPASTQLDASETSFARRIAMVKYSSDDLPQSREIRVRSSEAKLGRSMSKSIQAKLRRKSSRVEPSFTEDSIEVPQYHHVPQEAATQFERTATANSMREKNIVHSLSQSALKFHVEGRLSDRIELDSSITPAQQNRAMKRTQSHREKLHERNQFQDPYMIPNERDSAEEKRHQRHSVVGLASGHSRRKSSFGNILEDEALTIHPPAIVDLPIDEIASEETLVIDPAAANEHRVDWTQSDEVSEKPKVMRIPLLKKADSLWTLKGKIGNFTKNGHNRDERGISVREKQVSTPHSPSKSPKRGFFARFKR